MPNNPTAAQKKRWGKVRELGCLVCGAWPEIHHCFTQSGGRKNNNLVIPLCSIHHRHQGEGVSFHPFWKAWQKIYGSEAELLKQVAARLGEDVPDNFYRKKKPKALSSSKIFKGIL